MEMSGVDYKRCDQPPVLPRKDLEALGITYRRIPVLAVGKDIYCDSSLIIDLVNDKIGKWMIPVSPADKAWEAWGHEAFMEILTLIPLEVLTDDFVKDRETIFPILKRSDYKLMKPSGVAALKSRLEFIEKNVLSKYPHISGGKLGVADVHVLWGLRWGLNDLGAKKEPGLGPDAFPKLWKLIESLPEPKPETISGEDAVKAIKDSELSAGNVSVAKDDPLGIEEGTSVTIESVE
jgi:glutathione S-transferase